MARDVTNQGSLDTGMRGAAARRTANPRPIGRATLLAFALPFALLLGAMPQEARAKACESRKLRLSPGCITAKDVKPDDLTAKDRRDEAGMSFVAPRAATPIKVFSGALGPTKVVAAFSSKIPAGGVVIVTASAVLAAATAGSYGAVECDVIMAGPPPINRRRIRGALFGSVDDRDSLTFDSMAYMTGLALDRKTSITFELACGLVQALGIGTNAGPFGNGRIDLQSPSVTVQYFPTRY